MPGDQPNAKALAARAYYDANRDRIKAQQAEYRRRKGMNVGAGPGRPRLARPDPEQGDSQVTH